MPSLLDLLGGAVEPTLAMGSGAVAAPIAGLAGLWNLGMGSLDKRAGFTDPSADPAKDAANTVNSILQALTYQPRTQGGQNAMQVFNLPFQGLQKIAGALGDRTLAATGSPMAATAADTAMQALPILFGGRTASTAGRAVTEKFWKSLGPTDEELAAQKYRFGKAMDALGSVMGEKAAGKWIQEDMYDYAKSKYGTTGGGVGWDNLAKAIRDKVAELQKQSGS